MRVLQVNSVCGVGSTGKIVADLYSVIKSNNDECRIIYGRKKAVNCNIDNDDLWQIGGRINVYYHALMTRLFDHTGCYSTIETKKIIKKIKQYNPDIVHLHNLHGYYINVPMLFEYLSASSKKVVWTLHDCWPFTGHCSYFDMAKCDKWQSECCNCPIIHDYPQTMLFDFSKSQFMAKKRIFTNLDNLVLVTPSHWLSDITKKSFLSNCDIRVINNGINLDNFSVLKIDVDILRKYGISENKTVVLGVAMPFSKRKGFNDFIELSKVLNEKYQLVLVGLSEDQKQNLPKNIIGITRTNNQQELAELYNIASVFLNLTYEDNFPTTNIESLSCGTPVITYKTGGSVESINDNNGYIVEQGDINSVVSTIEKATKQLHDKTIIANDAHKKYSSNAMAEKYLTLYKELEKCSQ